MKLLLAAAFAVLLPAAVLAEPIAVEATPIPLNPADPQDRRVGPLAYLDGLVLTSADPRFGGWSGLLVENGRLLAVSDTGVWLEASLAFDAEGRLAGLTEAGLLPLLDLEGRPLASKREADAESLARLADGSLLVGFEQNPRIWRYASPTHPAEAWPQPRILEGRRDNGGLEALTYWPDGVVGILEGTTELQRVEGFRWDGEGYEEFVYPLSDGFRVTDAAMVPHPEGGGGELLVVERFYTPAEGVKVRLQLLDGGALSEPMAVLEKQRWGELLPPRSVDNFEALAVERDAQGRTLVYLLSDDNFNPLQRTLLLRFELTYE